MILAEKIIGARVYLRSLTEEDASSQYCDWLNDPAVNQFLETKSADESSLIRFITQKNEQPNAIFLGIFLREGNKHIGTIKLEPIDIENTKATIAIMIGDKKSWGKGLGGEAIKLLVDYAAKELQIKKIDLGVFGENIIAIHAYAKLGFREINREVGAVQCGDNIYDQVTMMLDLE